MRYGKEHKQEARQRMLDAAGRGFRRRGFGGIGVDGLAKEAHVTSGAFYGHFASKEAAFKEVAVAGLAKLRASVERRRVEEGDAWFESFVRYYMSDRWQCELGESCALQSLTPEVYRADDDIKSAYQVELEALAQAVAEGLTALPEAARLPRAWALLAILSGGVTMARAAADKAVAEEIAAGVARSALAFATA
ncbi:MAG: TetR/AcrR family transcriptional regulator [Alphaproteobacteria bacterium]